MNDTIFALSSGQPPAAIGLIRISGPDAKDALLALCGALPAARQAVLKTLRDATGDVLDQALVLWFPGPGTATGEDLAEIHCHGGRAVITAVQNALAGLMGLRPAQAGEFTRRAFVNGRINLAEAEGLADLLAAETDLQRRSALAMASGQLTQLVHSWREKLLSISGKVEANLDFEDEGDVSGSSQHIHNAIHKLHKEIAAVLAKPVAESLKEGFRIVLAGPPNAGKSTLFNALVQKDVAITTAIPGTTRDVLTHPVSIDGVPFMFYDTAGLREDVSDEVEAIGIKRAYRTLDNADLVLWLGEEGKGPDQSWEVAAQSDRPDFKNKPSARHQVSAVTGAGMDDLVQDLIEIARTSLPRPGDVALNRRQHQLLADAASALAGADPETDFLVVAEYLRIARVAFDSLIGRTTTEDMLDSLFGQFCIGK